MTRGRKPIPNKIKELRGTNQPVRMRNEMEIEAIGNLPEPPEWFTEASRKFYYTHANRMVKLGILTDIDMAAYIAMCEEYGTYITLTIEMKGIPMMAKMTDDAAKVYKRLRTARNEAWSKFYKLASDFGMSPVGRLRLDISKEEPVNVIDEIRRKNGKK